MTAFSKLLRRLPNYVRRFGLLHGLRTALAIERDLPRDGTVVRRFDVPGWQAPVLLRDSLGDHATFWQCVVDEQYALHRFPQAARLHAQYEARLRQGKKPLIIDCGANIGLASLWFAHAFPQAQIVAVEPDAANFALLQRNIAPYGGRITALQGGVWPVADHLRIDNPTAGSAAFRVVPCSADHPGAVRTYTIPGISSDVGVERPLIVKVDIEGAQGPLFSAHAEWVGASDLIVLELDDWQLPWTGTSRSFFAAISRWPFDYLLGGESIFCFRDYAADLASGGKQAGGQV